MLLQLKEEEVMSVCEGPGGVCCAVLWRAISGTQNVGVNNSKL